LKGKTRRCPHCGAPVAKKAKTCLMCGASLEGKGHLSSVPIFEMLILLAIVGSVTLWALKPWRKVRMEALSFLLPATVTSTAEARFTPPAVPSPVFTPTPTVTPTLTPIVHTVVSGETLTSIAAHYGTTVEAIAEANDIAPEQLLRVGQRLIIPSVGAIGGARPTATNPEVVIHVVQPGDSLYAICVRYGVSAEAIMTANKISNPELLRIGQELIIPLETPMPAPTPTPRPTSTPTPGPPYQAPVPLRPADGQVFHGTEEPIMLAWTSVGILGDDEYYLVRLRYLMDDKVVAEWHEWRKDTSWRVPSERCPPLEARSHLFLWDVTVMHRVDGKDKGEPISPTSESRSFYWY